jgi:hypothetical protein
MPSLRLLSITVVMMLLIGMVVPPVALASCNPGRPNVVRAGFAGTQRTPAAWPRAVQTKIEEYSPYVFGSSEVSAWNMLNNGGSKWSQVGWWKENGVRWSFIQWTDNAGNWFTNFYSPLAVGSTPNYETIYNIPTTDWIWERNNQVLHTANALWQPKTVQIYGETHTKADQMPGGVDNHNTFTEAHYIPNNGGAWLDIASAAGTNDAVTYGAVKINNEHYQIWDKACSS